MVDGMEDAIFSVGSALLIVALLPMLWKPWDQKPAAHSAWLTGAVLLAFSVCYARLDLPYAAITTFITAVIWFWLGRQKAFPSGREGLRA